MRLWLLLQMPLALLPVMRPLQPILPLAQFGLKSQQAQPQSRLAKT